MPGMKVAVALSTHPDTVRGAREVCREALARAGLERAGWALCFFSMAHLPRADALRETLLAELGCETLTGCSAHGLVAGTTEVEDKPGIALLVADSSGTGLSAQAALLPGDGDGLETLLPDEDDGTALLFAMPDAYRVDVQQLLTRIHDEHPALPVFGAGSTDNGTTGIALQLGSTGVRSSSVAALSLSGALDYTVGITQSCHPVGEPHFITAARDNVMLEIDGRPALQVLVEQGQALELADFQQLVEELLMGFPIDSESPAFTSDACLVRHLVGFDQQAGGIAVPDPMEAQRAMIFMHRTPEQAERDMKRMVRDVAERMEGPPDFGFYFDCSARGRRLYGRDGVDTQVIRETLGEFPLIGMLGGFEMATTVGYPLLYTYTGVLVLVRARRG